MLTMRASGILLHPTSLPGPYGLGDIGPRCRAFLGELARAGQSVWQVLPLNPTGNQPCPYSATSNFATNPLLISIDDLIEDGLLKAGEAACLTNLRADKADFRRAIPARELVLELAARRLASKRKGELATEFAAFCEEHGAGWLDDYSLWEALSQAHDRAHWIEWPAELRDRDASAMAAARIAHADQIAVIKALQYLFERQWRRLRATARAHGISIIGDMPIFVGHNSAEVWARPDLFQLEPDGSGTFLAGAAPDYFSPTGQLWGNPLYRWDKMETEGFEWWLGRMRRLYELVDTVRIDHFRGFAASWATPAGHTTAEAGFWQPAPGHALFTAMRAAFPHLSVIAEDLGIITPDVEDLRDAFGFPGLKVLQFELGAPMTDERHPRRYPANSVCCTSTHDTNTVRGWFLNDSRDRAIRAADAPREAENALAFLGGDGSDIHWRFADVALGSGSNLVVMQLQDIMGLDGAGRMNFPGTIDRNWDWRFEEGDLTPDTLDRLASLTRAHGRAELAEAA